ncbi:MAG TPA: hypothetical protein VLS93_04695 [Anaeromyxobacteraceae bacterium]|nr:hypothetical protein [Anaeromyxobacteraceae bacterium]
MTPNAERAGPPAAELARMLVTLFWVVAATLVLLAGLGALPRWLAGEEKGPVLAGSVPVAERRLGSSLFLPAYFPDRLAWPPGEVRVSGGPGGSARLVFRPREAVGSPVVLLQSVEAGEPVAPDLVGDRRVLSSSRTRVGERPAEFASVLVEGEGWQELTWEVEGRRLVLRSRGDLEELYRMAHSVRREGR